LGSISNITIKFTKTAVQEQVQTQAPRIRFVVYFLQQAVQQPSWRVKMLRICCRHSTFVGLCRATYCGFVVQQIEWSLDPKPAWHDEWINTDSLLTTESKSKVKLGYIIVRSKA